MKSDCKVIPIIWRQERLEAVLLCRNEKCNDVAIYTFPKSYPINNIQCEMCGMKRMTSKIPRSKQF